MTGRPAEWLGRPSGPSQRSKIFSVFELHVVVVVVDMVVVVVADLVVVDVVATASDEHL